MPKRKRLPTLHEFAVDIDGKAVTATYEIADKCVRATHEGRQSTWPQIGGLPAEHVARMLLRELV